jgi:acylaminoacyl-peptidase
MDRDGSNPRRINQDMDRNANNLQWSADGKQLYFQYDDQGNTKVARMDLQGKVTDLTNNVGGLSLGRPYSGGDFTVAENGRFAYTLGTPEHPADLAVASGRNDVKRLTEVNADLFSHKKIGVVEEIWYESSFDGRKVQGWICKPPDFDPNKKYPLLLEIHGGPFTNYGSRFSAEVQLYAAAGYVVLYTNPRGSTSYGEEFANLIHHNYPGEDYHDLISGVDAVIEKGYIDEDRLYVTGGSGGGVLSAWIIGNTDRFRAAVVAKPVINWSSFVLHADGPAFFSKYWFPGFPWEAPEQYWKRSPLSLVGNVKTPTMLLTGEQDYRTPISETEQYYAALKLNKVDAAMVRIQDSGHGIANKPSNLMNKVAYVLGWFDKHQPVKP